MEYQISTIFTALFLVRKSWSDKSLVSVQRLMKICCSSSRRMLGMARDVKLSLLGRWDTLSAEIWSKVTIVMVLSALTLTVLTLITLNIEHVTWLPTLTRHCCLRESTFWQRNDAVSHASPLRDSTVTVNSLVISCPASGLWWEETYLKQISCLL